MCLNLTLNSKVHLIDIPILNGKKMYYVRTMFTNQFELEYEGYQMKVKYTDLTPNEISYLEDYITYLQLEYA